MSNNDKLEKKIASSFIASDVTSGTVGIGR